MGMDKKLVYIAPGYGEKSVGVNNNIGVERKIGYQLEQFQRIGYKTYVKSPAKLPNARRWANILNPFGSVMEWSTAGIKINVDVVYIRHSRIDYPFLKLLADIKKNNKDVKVILEVPSYPYKGEMISPKAKALYVKDRIYSCFLHKYIDRITTPAVGYRKIFGVPVIYIPNGADYEQNTVCADRSVHQNEIHLIAVSTMQFWHGYDRLIQGMADYYSTGDAKRTVVLHLVGKGKDEGRYRSLTEKYKLENYVKFEGFCEGEQLESIYANCQIAVGSLGIHRAGPDIRVSSLKLKEYAAKGLPIILSGKSDIANAETKPYILSVPYDDTPVKVERIVRFYDRLYGDGSETVHKDIRDAFRNVSDIKKLFQPVLDYIEN